MAAQSRAPSTSRLDYLTPVLQFCPADWIVGVAKASEAVAAEELILWSFVFRELVLLRSQEVFYASLRNPKTEGTFAILSATAVLAVKLGLYAVMK